MENRTCLYPDLMKKVALLVKAGVQTNTGIGFEVSRDYALVSDVMNGREMRHSLRGRLEKYLDEKIKEHGLLDAPVTPDEAA